MEDTDWRPSPCPKCGTMRAAQRNPVCTNPRCNSTGMQITDPKTAMDFIKGGKAVFTLVSVRTGTRYTYRVRESKDKRGTWFVDLLTGPDNTGSYSYLGFMKKQFGMNAGSKGNPHHPAFAAIDWLVLCLQNNHMPTTVEFWHESKCARCGRKLTTPESIQTGLGPECSKKVAT